jgi:hypothetical protein
VTTAARHRQHGHDYGARQFRARTRRRAHDAEQMHGGSCPITYQTVTTIAQLHTTQNSHACALGGQRVISHEGAPIGGSGSQSRRLYRYLDSRVP